MLTTVGEVGTLRQPENVDFTTLKTQHPLNIRETEEHILYNTLSGHT